MKLKNIFFIIVMISVLFSAPATSQLSTAIESGDDDLVETIISKTSNIDELDANNNTPLMYAINKGDHDLIDKLLEKKSSVNIQNFDGRTPLMFAVKKNDLLSIKKLLDNNADVTAIDNDYRSAIDYALDADNKKILKVFLEKEQNLSRYNYQTIKSILNIYFNSEEEYAFLFDLSNKYAFINMQIALNVCVLEKNEKNKNIFLEKQKQLFKKVAEREKGIFMAIYENNAEYLENLSAKSSANDDLTDKLYGISPLYYAMSLNNYEYSKVFIENKKYINVSINNYDDLPIFIAARQGNKSLAELCLPLMQEDDLLLYERFYTESLWSFNKEFINYTFDKFAEKLANKIGMSKDFILSKEIYRKVNDSIFFKATNNKNLFLARLLIENDLISCIAEDAVNTTNLPVTSNGNIYAFISDEDPLPILRSKWKDELYGDYLLKGVKDEFLLDETPFMAAIRNGQLDIVEIMISKNCDVNQVMKTSKLTPLLYSVNFTWPKISSLLIAHGARINYQISAIDYQKNNDYIYPLKLAILRKDNVTAKILIDKGALQESKNKNIEPPFFIAIRKNNYDLVKYMLDKGANMKMVYNGYSVLEYAKEESDSPEIIKLLENNRAK